MFGFVIALVCLVGLVLLARRRRYRYFGGRRGLWYLFRSLDTTPGQEKVIRDALLELQDAAGELRAQTREARPQLAEMLRAERVNEDALDSWLDSRMRAFDTLRPRVVRAVQRVHEVLDERQRRMFGDFVEHAIWYHRHHHPGCHHHRHAC